MFRWLKKLIISEQKHYQDEKDTLSGKDVKKRRAVASDDTSHPEVLYYLSEDKDVQVRRAVAQNMMTPLQASKIIAEDKDVDVRLALAERLVKLLPELSEDLHSQLYGFAVQALGVLAQDEMLKVRRALVTALRDHAYAPPSVVGQLARDIERDVSEPILRFCLRLSDDDLLDILSHHPEPWVISAIANRENVTEAVAEGVLDAGDIVAGKNLIKNKSADFGDRLMRKIVEKARDCPEWHEDLVLRKNLSMDMVRIIVGFANKAVLALLQNRKDFDPETSKEIAALVKRRIAFQQQNNEHETAEQKVNRYHKAGQISLETLQDALSWEEKDFVKIALARVLNVHPLIIEKICASRAAKPLVALSWFAGFPPRFSVEVQKHLGQVVHTEILYPRGGSDYPLARDEMIWQLEFYGFEIPQEKRTDAQKTK